MLKLITNNTVVRYVISGGCSAVVDLLVLYILNSRLGVQYLLSAVLAFFIAFSVSFTLQKFWTFGKKDLDEVHVELASYLGVSVLGLLFNTLLMYVFVSLLNVFVLGAQVIVGAIVAFITYFLAKKVFIKKTI